MEIGRILNDRYKIVERIGSGGMSTVYKAHEVGLEREVAVKVLISTLSGDPQLIERFNREAKTIASLQHNSIIPIYFYGNEDDFGSFLVMPMLKGGTLEQRLHQLDMLPSLTEVGELAEKLGSALQYAHDKGVVHRDIKFSNIMFDDAGSPYLMDFGIAKLLNTTNLTGTGMTVGTPNFMPPEQWRNDEITPAVDQYAFAVLLFAMLTKKMPFEADTAPALMYQHLQQPPPFASEHRDDIPNDIDQALNRALSKEPEDRFPTISEFTGVIAHSALASTRKYSGFFKAPIEISTRHKLSTTGIRAQNVMPNTPTEMVADQRIAGAKTTFANNEPVPSEQSSEGNLQDKSGLNSGAFVGGLLAVLLIGIIVIAGGFYFAQQMAITSQSTETAIAAMVEESETALAMLEASETIIAFEAQSANATQTGEADNLLTASASNTPLSEPSETSTDIPSQTPDATGTQQVIVLTEGAIEQATNNAALRQTGTALAIIQTEGASNNETATANANAISTATIEAVEAQTEQANNNATSTAIAIRNTEQASSNSSTQQALNRNSTATAFAQVQLNFEATATHLALMATQNATTNEMEYGEALEGTGSGEEEFRWIFSAEAGDIISISARSADFDTMLDLYFDDDLIVTDDDGGYLSNSRISNLRIEDNGDYELVLSSATGGGIVGDYVVGITEMLNCPSVLPAQILVGEYARISLDGDRNRLRRNPSTDSNIADLIEIGDVVDVIGGPICNEDFTWYQVVYNNNIGWTAEADDEAYWIELMPEDDEPVLLVGARGLTNSALQNPGEFQVEAFCSRRGLTPSTDETDWFCVNASNVVVITLLEQDFDQICRDTYGEEEAFARQDGSSPQPAYRWRCYYYPE